MIGRSLLIAAVLLGAAAPALPQSIANIMPNSANAGSGNIALTINGQFITGYETSVNWTSTRTSQVTPLNISTINNSQIAVIVPASLLTLPDTASVTVTELTTSNAATFTVNAEPPTLTSLNPDFAVAGSNTINITVNGINFPGTPSSPPIVTWNGQNLATSYVSSQQLTALVPSSLLTTPGQANVSLNIQPTPQPLVFSILTPLVLSSLNPNTAVAGSPSFTLTVNGSGFGKLTKVTWNGSTLGTALVNAQQVTAMVPANLVAAASTAQVAVTDGTQTSSSLPFVITAPLSLTSLSPPSAIAGGPAFTLTVNGTGFDATTVIYWNGAALPTVSQSANQMMVTVASALIAQAGMASVTAKSSTQTSNTLNFAITTALNLTSLSPSTATAGGPAFTLTVNGAGFTPNTTIFWNGTALPTVSQSAGQMAVKVAAALIAQPGSASVNAKDGAQTSNTLPFTIAPALTLTSLSPTSAASGGPAFTLTVNGTGFDSTTTIFWNGTALPTVSQNASVMSVTVSAALIAQPGTATVNAKNSTQTSNSLSFTVVQSLTLTSLSPASAVAGGAAFTLTVNGTGFDSNTNIYWNGTALPTVSTTANQMTVTVSPALIAQPGTATVNAKNSAQTSNSLPFTVLAALSLSSLLPSSTTSGGPSFTLTVNGSGFDSSTIIYWNGSTALPTISTTANQMTVTVSSALIAQPGTASVSAKNSTQTSNSLPFTISAPPLTLTSISPSTATAGGPAFTLTANGSGFTSATLVTWNGTALTTGFVSATQLTAAVPANLIANAGTASVNVSSPNQTSPAPLTFVISANIVLTSLSPSSVAPGGPSFLLTVNGTGFVAGTVILWNNLALPTTVAGSTVMTASVPAALVSQAGTATIAAQSGSTVSNSLTFVITGAQLTLSSLAPSTTAAGSAGFNLTVLGTGFLAPSTTGTVANPGTTVTWNGTSLVTQFVSTTQLTATVPASLLQTPGTVAVSVTGQPQPSSLPFTITGTLTLTSIAPSTLAAGGPGFTLTVNGAGFTNTTSVTWNGNPLPTTVISANELTAAVPAALIVTAGTASVGVSAPGQQSPAPLQFVVTPAFSLTSLSPTMATAGGPAFTLTVNGSGFTSATTVNWNSTPLVTTFISATQLTAAVTATLIAQPGSASITGINGSQVSNTLILTITPATPTITSLTPATAVAGGPAFTLTITGTGYLPTSTIAWNSTPLQATYVSATQLTAAVTAALIAQAGTASVVVSNGTLQSNAANFTITPLAPVISSISPSSVVAGSAAFTLTVTGTGFVTGAVVSFNTTALATTFVSATQVTAAVPASLIAQPGSAQITLANPNGPASNSVSLTITAPTPTITSISPSTTTAGGPAFTLTVTGTGFVSGAVVSLNTTALTTTFVSATQVTAAVPASLIAQPGSAQITLSNPGGAASNAVTLAITSPTPTITSIAPSNVMAGIPAFTLTVIGTNFQSGATVSLTLPEPSSTTAGSRVIRTRRLIAPAATTALTTTFVSATQLTAQVPADLVAVAGTAQITAANTNGAASNAVTLTINNPTPIITNISPSTFTIGSPDFTLTVNGSNFVPGATVQVLTSTLPTTFVSSTQVTAVVPSTLLPIAGQVLVTVTNPGTMPSNPLNLTVSAPVPTITVISPDTVQAGGPLFTLAINGTGFLSGATAFLNGTPLPTTVVSSTQLAAQVAASLIVQAGTAQITAGNPGGAQSMAVTLTITPATPTLISISPVSARVGDPTFTLSLTGTGFVPASIAQWNGSPLSTTFVSSTTLTATIDAGRLILPATASVTVVSPGPNGTALVSNAVTFTINPVMPTISSISPNSAMAGGPAFSLTVNGTGMLSLTTIQWNSTMLTTHFVNAGQVTADVPANLIATAGTAAVTAVNPGNNVSSAVTFTITAPAPAVITSLSKSSATAGDAAFTLTVTGTGFVSGAVVEFGTTALATTFVSATQVTASVTASLLVTPATVPVVVQQSGTTSNSVNFVVNLPAPPSLRLNAPTSTGPAQQPTIDFGLNNGYPIPISGTVTLTFAPNATVNSDDPAIQFTGGGRLLNFSVAANTTTLPSLQISTGTVAGTISLAVTLTASGVNVTPANSTITIPIARSAPVILPGKVTLIRANGYLEVDITGYSTTRDMTQAVFTLNAAPGGSFTASVLTVPLSPLFSNWYQSAASTAFGSQFTYAQPFAVIGDGSEIQSVTVTLTNSAGTSVSATGN